MANPIAVMKVPYDASVPSATVPTPEWTATKASISRFDSRVVDTSRFGAVGDGSTDDSAAIQAAANALPKANGGLGTPTLAFQRGVFIIDSTVEVDAPGLYLMATGSFSTLFAPGPNLPEGAPLFRLKDSTYVMRGCVVENIVFDMATRPCDGIEIVGAYDQTILRNVFMTGLNGNTNGISMPTRQPPWPPPPTSPTWTSPLARTRRGTLSGTSRMAATTRAVSSGASTARLVPPCAAWWSVWPLRSPRRHHPSSPR